MLSHRRRPAPPLICGATAAGAASAERTFSLKAASRRVEKNKATPRTSVGTARLLVVIELAILYCHLVPLVIAHLLRTSVQVKGVGERNTVLPVLSFPAHKFPPTCNSIATNGSAVTR